MKLSILIIILCFTFKFAECQSKTIDSLIQLLDNRQIRGECHYIWEIHMISEEGRALQTMGKTVYPYLASYLADTCKGIIVHFIMQAIHSNVNLGLVKYRVDEKGETLITDLHGLNIYTNKQRPYYFAKPEELEENKNRWINQFNINCR